jgi:hypothetical protein
MTHVGRGGFVVPLFSLFFFPPFHLASSRTVVGCDGKKVRGMVIGTDPRRAARKGTGSGRCGRAGGLVERLWWTDDDGTGKGDADSGTCHSMSSGMRRNDHGSCLLDPHRFRFRDTRI